MSKFLIGCQIDICKPAIFFVQVRIFQRFVLLLNIFFPLRNFSMLLQ